jgi:gamma-glutamylcyclotransferase (GGCT)/AIG2-like uncharacterized protein YtfP
LSHTAVPQTSVLLRAKGAKLRASLEASRICGHGHGMPLYFAYGSNMDLAAMAQRCPASKPVGPARLARHRFLINADGYATVARHPRGDVHGMLFDLALSDMPALDRYEGIARGLYTKVQQPVITTAGPRKAMVYIGRSAEPGVPKPGYLEGVIAAAESAGLPEAYVRSLRGFGAGSSRGETIEAPAAPQFRAIGSKQR